MLLIANSSMKAQSVKENINQGFGFGYGITQHQNDFGMGLNLVSPTFINNNVAVRLKGHLMFHQHVSEGTTIWSPYSNVSLGLIGFGGFVGEHIRLYGEGGMIALIPNEAMSSESLVLGGYGVFGFEFFFARFGNYFIEIGGVGTAAQADNLQLSPIYSNGMTVSAGFRFFL